MYTPVKQCVFFLVVAALAAAFVVPVAADVELTDVSWTQTGTTVQFHLQFHNPDQLSPSPPVSGVLSSQPFGAFVPNSGVITTFEVPQLNVDSFFDIWYDVDVTDLPPSAEVITPGGGGGGTASSSFTPCDPFLTWAGNVDVFWDGPGGSGQVNYHFGEVQVCAGDEPSYIHVIMGCDDPAGTSWSFSPLCAGWTASLVLDNGSFGPGAPAPNPIPTGVFDGWICITADSSVNVGDQCCLDLNLMCGVEPATITVCADACIWAPVSTEESNWGRIKSLYKSE